MSGGHCIKKHTATRKSRQEKRGRRQRYEGEGVSSKWRHLKDMLVARGRRQEKKKLFRCWTSTGGGFQEQIGSLGFQFFNFYWGKFCRKAVFFSFQPSFWEAIAHEMFFLKEGWCMHQMACFSTQNVTPQTFSKVCRATVAHWFQVMRRSCSDNAQIMIGSSRR